MSKMLIKWHQECFDNCLIHANKGIERALKDLETAEANLSNAYFYQLQIETSIMQDKDGFDRERFMQKNREPFIQKAKERLKKQHS